MYPGIQGSFLARNRKPHKSEWRYWGLGTLEDEEMNHAKVKRGPAFGSLFYLTVMLSGPIPFFSLCFHLLMFKMDIIVNYYSYNRNEKQC